jgi:hypothetical protein
MIDEAPTSTVPALERWKDHKEREERGDEYDVTISSAGTLGSIIVIIMASEE